MKAGSLGASADGLSEKRRCNKCVISVWRIPLAAVNPLFSNYLPMNKLVIFQLAMLAKGSLLRLQIEW